MYTVKVKVKETYNCLQVKSIEKNEFLEVKYHCRVDER